MKNKKILFEIVGWYGTFAILGAYAFVSFNIISADTFIYQFLNGSGAIGIITISSYKKVYQSVALNLVWLAIAIIAIIGMVI